MGERWPAVAALLDQVRRALYDYVRRQDHPVSREEAAGSQSISRGLAAFHLDKLVDVGLLKARTDQPRHRRGRGRRPKVYEPAGDGLVVTFPQREYELVGEILADTAAEGSPEHRAAIMREARRRGMAFGAASAAASSGSGHPASDSGSGSLGSGLGSSGSGSGSSGSGAVHDAIGALQSLGFEPERVNSTVVLRNCPFHALAMRQTELVCAINLAFVGGMLTGIGADDTRAVLMPKPPACCVQLQETDPVNEPDSRRPGYDLRER
jgi:predicted ArsR family transcriptional regulator